MRRGHRADDEAVHWLAHRDGVRPEGRFLPGVGYGALSDHLELPAGDYASRRSYRDNLVVYAVAG